MRLFADVGGADDEVGPVILAGELAPQPIERATDLTQVPGVASQPRRSLGKPTCKFGEFQREETGNLTSVSLKMIFLPSARVLVQRKRAIYHNGHSLMLVGGHYVQGRRHLDTP